MANIVLKQRDGSTQEYPGSLPIAVPKSDGSLQVYTAGEAVSKTVEPDFSGGDMAVEIPEGELVTGLTVKKPDTLVPENISKGVTVAGVTGTAEGGTAESEEKTVTLDFSSGDMTVEPSAGKLLSKVGIPKPATLLPGNIKKNVTISGVTGTLDSGGTPTPVQQKHAICYYDIYGNIVHSYTRAEVAALTEEPAGPALEGFEFAGWSLALASAKSETAFADIVPKYTKDGIPCSILLVDIPAYSLVLNVCGAYNSIGHWYIEIDWGDGEKTIADRDGSSTTSNFSLSHTYTKAGIKLVSMRGIANEAQTEYSTSLVASWGNTIDNVSRSAIYSPDDSPDTEFHYKLLGVSQNSNWSGNSIFASMYRIKVIDSAESVSDCPKLEAISGLIENVKNCLSLTRLKATYSISRSALAVYRLDCLKDFYVSGSAFLRPQIQTVVNKVRMVYKSMPRTAAKTDNCQYGTEYIYIPDANVEAAKAYPIFEPVADYIRPLSEYPDF